MNFTSQKTKDDSLELMISCNQEDLAGFIKKTEAAFARELEVPGFRKGKAPHDVVRKEIGETRIRESALESAVQESLATVIADEKLDVLEATDLKVTENSPEKLAFKVVLKLFPTVVLPDLATVKAGRREVVVETEEINDTLEAIKSSRAVLTATDGPAATGDRVEVDFEIKENGTVIKDGTSKNHPVTIGAKNFVPGFEDHLIGLKKGEHCDFTLTVPSDFANKTIAGKTLEFSVTMQDVKKVSLPELSDEFAKTLGKFDNVDQLILNVKDGLLEEKNQKEKQRLRLEILDGILAKAECVVPKSMVDAQLETMIQNLDHDLHYHDMELNMYLAKIGKTQDDLRKEWRPEAERQVKLGLVLHAVARAERLAVQPREIDNALNGLAQQLIARGDDGTQLDLGRMRTRIQSELLNEKTLEFLEQRCAQ